MYEINYLIKSVTITEILTHDSHRDENSRHSTATHSNQVTGQDGQCYLILSGDIGSINQRVLRNRMLYLQPYHLHVYVSLDLGN